MTYQEAVDLVADKLWTLICAGGGDGETIDRCAEQIVALFVDEDEE